MSSWKFWDDFYYLTNLVEDYRKNRDPAFLIRFILQNHEAMQSPQIGRLFLDMLSGQLSPLEHRVTSTNEIRERAVNLVLFYMGQGLNKSNAFSQAGTHLNKASDTVKGYFNSWVNQQLVHRWNGSVTKDEFWSNIEKYARSDAAFSDGRLIIDEELANRAIARHPGMGIAQYRQIVTALYEKGKAITYPDPWDEAKADALLDLKIKPLNYDDSGE